MAYLNTRPSILLISKKVEGKFKKHIFCRMDKLSLNNLVIAF